MQEENGDILYMERKQYPEKQSNNKMVLVSVLFLFYFIKNKPLFYLNLTFFFYKMFDNILLINLRTFSLEIWEEDYSLLSSVRTVCVCV